jgi:hypothetical protein
MALGAPRFEVDRPCGCVVFEDLDPYCDYMISEEMQDGWIPAPGWETKVVFIHGVDFSPVRPSTARVSYTAY